MMHERWEIGRWWILIKFFTLYSSTVRENIPYICEYLFPQKSNWCRPLHTELSVGWFNAYSTIYTSGIFCRSCVARTRHFGLITTPNGALRAPVHSSFAASYALPKIKNKLFPEKMLSFRPELGRQGRIFLHWTTLHPPELYTAA
jgi:hypothetical protein